MPAILFSSSVLTTKESAQCRTEPDISCAAWNVGSQVFVYPVTALMGEAKRKM